MKRLSICIFALFMLISAKASGFNIIESIPAMYNDQPAIAVIFDEPVDLKSDFNKFISLHDHSNSALKIRGIADPSGQIIYLSGLQNNAVYNLYVNKGLKAAGKGSLQDNYYNEIRTNKLDMSAWFASPSMVVIPSDKAVLPVTVSNIDAFLVNVYKTDISKSKYWFERDSNRKDYSSDIDYYLRNGYEPVFNYAYSADAINKQTTVNIELPKEMFDMPGVYYAIIQQPGSYSYLANTTFIISDIGIQARQYEEEGDKSFHIWTRSLSTGEPIPGVTLRTVHYYDTQATSAKTNADGYAVLKRSDDNNRNPYLIVAEKGNHYAILNISRSIDLSDFSTGVIPFKDSRFFIYGARDLYRGGERFTYNILSRDYDGKVVDPGAVTIELINPRGQEVNKEIVKFNKTYSYYEYSYDLPENAPTGNWTLAVDSGDITEMKSFAVEDFMPETLKLTLGNPAEPLIVSKKTATNLDILGEYLYGAPASGNNLEVYYNIRPAAQLSDKWKGYSFGNDISKNRSMNNSISNLTLDKDGKIRVSISNNSTLNTLDKGLNPVKIQYHVTLYESGGRAINRGKEYVYMPVGEALGIKPGFESFAPTQGETTFEIININDNEKPVGAGIIATLHKQVRNYYWEYNQDRGWISNYTLVEFPVQTENIEIGTKPSQLTYRLDGGYYRLTVKNISTGQENSYEFTAGYSWYWWWWDYSSSSMSTKPESLSIVLDKPHYNAKETAKVAITSPYDGVGKIFVENSSGILWSSNLEIVNKTAKIEIPVSNHWDSHDIYVSAYVARNENELEKTQKSVVFGLQHFPLDRSSRIIELDVTHPQKVVAGKDFDVVVKTKDKSQYGGKAMVTLAVVDQGVLSLKHFDTPDAGRFFFSPQSYSIKLWDNFWQVIHKYSDKMALRYGGDADMMRAAKAAKGGELARADVKIRSYFSAPVVFDNNGEAHFKLAFPDFNGELRVMALAYGDGTYGMSETTITSAEDVITELSMPRFLATGDSAVVALDLRNMMAKEKNISVSITTTAPLRMPNKTYKQSMLLKTGERKILSIPIEGAGTSGYGNINVKITYDNEIIEKSWRLAVRPPYPAVSKMNFISLEKGNSALLYNEDLAQYVKESAYMTVSIDTLPPFGIAEQAKWLIKYPYGCLEQTTSQSFVNLYMKPDVVKKFNIKLTDGDSYNRDEYINTGIARILQKQLSSGGFGYWDSSSPESAWGTVFATDFLNMAAKMGYNVDKNALNKANNRINSYIRNDVTDPWLNYYDSSDVYRFNTKAYASYVLAVNGKGSVSDIRNIASQRNLARTPVPLFHMAAAIKHIGDRKLADDIINEAKVKLKELGGTDSSWYYGDYSSTIRDRAWSISLAVEYYGKTTPDIVEMVYQLSDNIKSRSWFSTQERIRILEAATAIGRPDKLTGQLTINGKKEDISVEGFYEKTFKAEDLKDLSFKSSTAGTVFIKTDFSAYPVKAPAMLKENATVIRSYYDIHGNKIDLQNVKTGDFIVVRLNFASSYSSVNGLLVDLIPAGFELENQNLDNSFKLSNVKLPSFHKASFVYSEYRDDRFVAAVLNSKNYEYSVWYIMRAVTPGTYINPSPYYEDMYRSYIRAVGVPSPEYIHIKE